MGLMNECEICGAALDPGEVCDCKNNGLALICTQPPVIFENLDSVRQNLDTLLAEVSTLPANDESLKKVKQIRANLSKDFDSLERQRKEVKRQIMEPYSRAEEKYKACISDPYRAADLKLKEWVDGYQDGLKGKCEAALRSYFAECCQSLQIDFLKFEDCGVTVDMAMARQKTPSKAIDKIFDFVTAVRTDLDVIATMEDAAEVFAAYRQRLNLAETLAFIESQRQAAQQAQASLAAMKQTAAIEAEVVKKVEAVAPPTVIAAADKEPVICCAFKAIGTRTQIKKMKEFAIKEGIRFE